MRHHCLLAIAHLFGLIVAAGCATGPVSVEPESVQTPASVNAQSPVITHTERNLSDDRLLAEAGRKELVIGDAPVYGNDDAPITVVAYLDFDSNDNSFIALKSACDKSNGRIRFVYKHQIAVRNNNTIPIHRALEAAKKQGKFWEMAERLFRDSALYEKSNDLFDAELQPELYVHAESLGLDMDLFVKDMWGDDVKDVITSDLNQVNETGYRKSSVLFVNGQYRHSFYPDDNERINKVLQKYYLSESDNPYVEQSKLTKDRDDPVIEVHRRGHEEEKIVRSDSVYIQMKKLENDIENLTATLPDPEHIDDSQLTDEDYGVLSKRAYIDTTGLPFKGNKTAPVTVILLNQDKYVYDSFSKIAENNKGKIKLYAIMTGQNNVSMALEAAAKQKKYWQMFEALMNQDRYEIDDSELENMAKSVGINLKKFKLAMNDNNARDAISQRKKALRKLRIHCSPSYLINGRDYCGRSSADQLESVIDREYQQTREFVSRGISDADMYKSMTSRNRSVEEARAVAKKRLESDLAQKERKLGKMKQDLQSLKHSEPLVSRLISELKLPVSEFSLRFAGVESFTPHRCDINEDAMKQSLRDAETQAKTCLDYGTLNVALHISQNGKAEVTSNSGSLQGTEAEKCILEKLTSYQYPEYSCSRVISDDGETMVFEGEDDSDSDHVYQVFKELDLYTKAYLESFKTRMVSKDIYSYTIERKVNNEESEQTKQHPPRRSSEQDR